MKLNRISKKNVVLLILSTVCLFSCNTGKRRLVSETKDENGYTIKKFSLVDDSIDYEIIVLDTTGVIKEKYFEKQGRVVGPYFSYFTNGIVESKGQMNNGKKNGWFKYFDFNGNIIALREFIAFRDTGIGRLNRVIKLAPNGDTLRTESFYYRIFITKDTIDRNEEFPIKIILDAPLLENAQVHLCDFDEKYNFLPNAVCDSFLMKNNTIVVGPKEYKQGQNFVRGLIYNYGRLADKGKNDTSFYTAELYFSVGFYVR